MNADVDEAFEERAAILEYCANLPRAEAERQARAMCGSPSASSPDLKPCVEAALNDMRRMLKQ